MSDDFVQYGTSDVNKTGVADELWAVWPHGCCLDGTCSQRWQVPVQTETPVFH